MNLTEEMVYWINEREQMRMRKAGPPQWKHGYSDDPNMGTVRYCNVRREDDKVTKWLAEHWRPNHRAVWKIVLARMINYIPSLEQILVGWEQHPYEARIARAGLDLKIERDLGKKVFTSAYTISTCGQSMDKIDYVMEVVEAVRDREREKLVGFNPGPVTLGAFHSSLMCVKGLGSFLAAQVAADLKNTTGHPLQTAPDWWTWCAPGPGSRRGLSWYFYGSPDVAISDKNFTRLIEKAWAEVSHRVPSMHMQDFQNCLCEFSKYMRVKGGDRRVRNKYPAG